jgi:hypothetical protein
MNRENVPGIIKKKDPIIRLPIKVILTDEAINFFIKQKRKLHRFKMADSDMGWGFSLDTFSPASIQKMILIDYVSNIEINRLEFLSKRSEIIDINKLLIYSLLYKKFDNVIIDKILRSPLIAKWNRANPRRIIDERTNLNEAVLKKTLLSRQEVIREIKMDILNPVSQEIKRSPNLHADEKAMQIMICQKLCNSIRPFSWYLLSTSKGTQDYYSLIQEIKKIIKDYLEKTSVAEYISLILMELAMNAENTNLQKYAQKIYQKTFTMDTFVSNKQIRNRVLQKLQSSQEFLYMDWFVTTQGRSMVSSKIGLRITLYNKEYEYEMIKSKIEDKSNIDLHERPLMDFYEQLPETMVNVELGLYYLTYLHDACEKLKIRFESKVGQLSKSELPMITLDFYF